MGRLKRKFSLFLSLSFFHFGHFLTAFANDYMKKPSIFITTIESSHKFLQLHKVSSSRNFGQQYDGLLNLWRNLLGNAFLWAVLAKSGKFQSFISTEMSYFAKLLFLEEKSNFGNVSLRFDRPSKTLVFRFLLFHLKDFLFYFCRRS